MTNTTRLRPIDRLRRTAEGRAARAAAIEARSEAELARRAEAGIPVTERELAYNLRTRAIAWRQAELAEAELTRYLARHPELEADDA